MGLSLSFQVALKAHCKLVVTLGLASEYIETFLVRTETFLRGRRGEKALRALRETIENDPVEYRGVVDAVLGVANKRWYAHIKHWYTYAENRLGDALTPEQIDEMDQILSSALEELASLSEEAEDNLVLEAYIHFVGSRLPPAPRPGMGRACRPDKLVNEEAA